MLTVYILVLALLMSHQVGVYGPEGAPVVFPTLAACERVQEEQSKVLETADVGEPFLLQCVEKPDDL